MNENRIMVPETDDSIKPLKGPIKSLGINLVNIEVTTTSSTLVATVNSTIIAIAVSPVGLTKSTQEIAINKRKEYAHIVW